MIAKNEALRLTVYDDANGKHVVPGYLMVGHPTIGYGRALDVNGISEVEANYLLSADIAMAQMDLRFIFGVPLWTSFGEPRQAALTDMRFTLGPGGFRRFPAMIAAATLGNWEAAADDALDSIWAKNEATERAEYDAQLLRTGTWA